VRDQSHRLVSLPDANRTWFSVGGQWQATKASAVDLGLAYIFVPDTKIDNDQTSANPLANRGRVTGEYDSSVWLFGAQYSMAF
jgi:long-chain fatty acid transport protein